MCYGPAHGAGGLGQRTLRARLAPIGQRAPRLQRVPAHPVLEAMSQRRPGRPSGPSQTVWSALLLFALVLLLWIVLAAEAAYQHRWANFGGYTCIALFFLAVPTGMTRRLGRRLKDRKPGT
jgi:hypothetical protein